MIKKDGRLIKWFWFQMYECSRVEKFLTDMARKGWMVETFVGNKFIFQPCEPNEVRFSVEIFDESSESNVFQNNATLTYIEYCEQAGWTYVVRDKKIHVFYTTDIDAVSIETDDELTLSTINKNIWMENINWFIMPVLGVLQVKMQIRNYIYFLSDYGSILLILAWLGIIFNATIGLISYISWYIATKNRIRNNRPLKYYDGKNRSVVKMLNTIFVFAILGFYSINEFINGNKAIVIGFNLLLVIFIFWVKYVPSKKVLSRKKNIIFMQIIVIIVSAVILITATTFSLIYGDNSENNSEVFLYYNSGELRLETIKHDEVPITLEDYGIQSDNSASSIRETSVEVNATIFAQDYTYYDNYNSESYDYQNGISYEVFQSDFQWVIDNYLETRWFYSENILEFTEVDPSDFRADKVYVQDFENGGYRYIAVYGKKVLIFTPDEAPTKEQIELFIKTFKFS